MHRSHSALLVTAVVATVFLFIYSFYGASVFPREFAENYNDQLAAALNYDTSIVFSYGTPIQAARVVDGDTVQLVNGEYVRYNGIDTPESVDPRKREQCFAKEAATRNRELVEGKHITVFQDVSEKDKYGRWVGLVYLEDGTFVNDTLVKEGYAFAYPYPPDIAKAEVFAEGERIAKELMLGLWSACKVKTLSTGRGQTNDVR
jgi:endonuclease YncB( thermonuclease family)